MSPRQPVFISAVSRELKSARQLVVNTLTFLGYQPVWQDIFGTEGGDLRGLLRKQIDQCKGVVQLVGQCYGAEPLTADEEFGRISYTQYEALYARKRGKKIWYLFIDEQFPADSCEVEAEDVRELQAAYRRRLQSDTHVFHALTSSDALEASVLKLREDLTRLQRGVKQWAGGMAILLGLVVALVIWLVHGQAVTTTEMTKLREAVMKYPRVDAQVREAPATEDATAMQDRVYTELARQLGVDVKLLREKLPQFAEQLKHAPEATHDERGNAAYVELLLDQGTYRGTIQTTDGVVHGRPLTINFVAGSDCKSGTMTQESTRGLGLAIIKFSGVREGRVLHAVTGEVVYIPTGITWEPEAFTLHFTDDGKAASYETTALGKTYIAALQRDSDAKVKPSSIPPWATPTPPLLP